MVGLMLAVCFSCGGQPTGRAGASPDEAAGGEPAAERGHGQGREAATSVAPTQGTGPQAREWLWRIGEKHKEARTLEAELTYDRVQGVLEDTQRRLGKMVYRAGPPAQFAVHFDRLLVDQRLVEQDRWYVFDGRWLVERLVTERQFFAYEVVPPNAGPVDPLAVGQGPFVVPISPDPARLLERFDVAVVEGDEEGPEAGLHLRMTPKPERAGEFTQIDVWYDRQTLLPVQVRTMDRSENESRVALRNVKVNVKEDARVFDTKPPAERGWDVQISPWEEQRRVGGR
jgi:hypothetical protein